jgi:hypothetical protein
MLPAAHSFASRQRRNVLQKVENLASQDASSQARKERRDVAENVKRVTASMKRSIEDNGFPSRSPGHSARGNVQHKSTRSQQQHAYAVLDLDKHLHQPWSAATLFASDLGDNTVRIANARQVAKASSFGFSGHDLQKAAYAKPLHRARQALHLQQKIHPSRSESFSDPLGDERIRV